MSVDPEVIDLAARIDRANKEIERLETLEYETTAFPTGGGLALVCDVVLLAPSAGLHLCAGFGSIPQTFRHLWFVIAAQTDAPVAGKMRMRFNSFVPPPGPGDHEFYVREEVPFGVPVGATDTEAADFGPEPSSDSFTKICHPAGFEALPPAATNNQCACFVQIPHYTNLFMTHSASYWGFAVPDGANGGFGVPTVDQGQMGVRTSSAPVTSLGIAPAVGELFLPGSQFTLYGL